MPQLNKGGKYVFGLSAISNRREILFPAETLEQYPVQKEGRIIIFTGSKITGGFCVTSKQLLGQSYLAAYFSKRCCEAARKHDAIFESFLWGYSHVD